MKKSKEKVGKKRIQKLFYKTNPYGGISLIVLVITIIVVIILAAAVIISLQNNNPIIEANKARINSDVANMQAVFTNTVGKIMAESKDIVEIEKGQLNTVTNGAKKTEGIAKYEIKGAEGNAVVEGNIIFKAGNKEGTTYYTGKELPLYKGETKWYVDEQGIISLNVNGTKYGEGNQEGETIPPKPEEPEYEEAVVGEKVKESVKQYTDVNGDRAIIPIDFAIVPGKDVVKDGLVISDVENDTGDEGNQFVWVPVKDMSTFEREQGYYNGNLQTNYSFESFSEPLEYEGELACEDEINEYNKMKASVEEYHGFYIGRYEISNDGADNAQSKKNKDPWVSIKWGNSMNDLSGGMVEKAREMYKEAEATKGKAVSTLVYGVCWDETIRFIKKNYPNIEKNSSGHGNYGTGSKIQTGSREEYALNNIYDIAGNVWEWTMEAYQSTSRGFRGGIHAFTGLYCPVSCRNHLNFSDTDINLGGRCQIYIK